VTGARLATILLLGAAVSGCHSAHYQASPTTPTAAAAPTTTTQLPAPPVSIQPLPVRPVQKSQPTTSNKCPATNPNARVAPSDVLVACDLAQTTPYTLAPEAMQLALTQVDPPKSLTSSFYEVNLTMDPPSAAAWAAFTAAHLHAHVAFTRDDLVLEAPLIEKQVTYGKIALTTQTPQAADQLAQLARRPA
jgi:preprotein translocase subunit SecD